MAPARRLSCQRSFDLSSLAPTAFARLWFQGNGSHLHAVVRRQAIEEHEFRLGKHAYMRESNFRSTGEVPEPLKVTSQVVDLQRLRQDE